MLNFLAALVLLGAIQGFITSFLLVKSPTKAITDRLLAWLIFLISLACLNIYLLNTLPAALPTFWSILRAVIPMIIIMPIGPLIYFYTKASITDKFSFAKRDRIHFVPVILDVIPELTSIIYLILIGFNWMDKSSNWGNFIDHYNRYIDGVRWLTLSVYLWKSCQLYYQTTIRGEVTNWLKQLIYGFIIFQFIWLCFLIPYLIPSTSQVLLALGGWYPIYLPLMILVYWLSIRGYLMRRIQKPKQLTTTTVLDEQTIQHTIETLEKAMKHEQLYLDAELKLNKLVRHTGIPQKTISAVLNQHIGKSFNEYVNGFRVEEVKLRLVDDAYQHLTITGIALACGFNSQATFQRAFKTITKQSPSAFRKENRSKMH